MLLKLLSVVYSSCSLVVFTTELHGHSSGPTRFARPDPVLLLQPIGSEALLAPRLLTVKHSCHD